MRNVMATSLAELDHRNDQAGADEPARLNTILTDGQIMVATRIRNSLSWVERIGIHDCEICGIPHVHQGGEQDYRALVLASEPLSQERWSDVPDGSIVTVDEQLTLDIRPLAQCGRIVATVVPNCFNDSGSRIP
jgi:glutamine amidotransferase